MDIDTLIAEGRHEEAAKEAERRGELARAQALYERIWNFAAAAEVARARGDKPELLRLLLEARDFPEAARVGEALQRSTPSEQERAALVYERRRMWAEAATLRERLGAVAAAQELYKRAHLPLEVARLDELAGRLREAGIIYERFVAEEPDAREASRAHLALGRIFKTFSRHEEAVRHLQKALADTAGLDAATLAAARHLLVVELAALGYRHGAAAVLDEARATDATLPDLDRFLARPQRAQDGVELLGGRYRVARLLGAGSMGRVYLAADALTGRDVAVKVVAPPVDARAADGYRRFLREATIVSCLRHPNIVGVVEVHEALGLFAMEYMSGGTLADRLDVPGRPDLVRAWAEQVLRGLEAAHAHGVVHRDLKPANIFFDAAGEAKLGDFGVAHLSDLGATQTAGFIGTLAYMSPEQISGAPLSFTADVYAFGVTLFQALTGRLPFLGPDLVGQHLGEVAPAPSSVRPELAAWDELVRRCLEKVPGERFASIEELRRAISAIPFAAKPAIAPPSSAAPAAEEKSARERYAIVGELDGGLLLASDTRLGRDVVIEIVRDGSRVAWLRSIARASGPRVQRVLRLEPLDDGATRVVYEALVGAALPSLTRDEQAIVKRALLPLHRAGVVHGSVARSLVREAHGPALLIAGRQPRLLSPDDELAELERLTAED